MAGQGPSATLDQCFREVTFELRTEGEDVRQESSRQKEEQAQRSQGGRWETESSMTVSWTGKE